MCEASEIRYTDDIAKAFAALWNLVERSLLPDMTEEDRGKFQYFNRRAPGSKVGIESHEELKGIAQFNTLLAYMG